MTHRKILYLFLLVFVLGAVIRGIGIEQKSLWMDEVVTLLDSQKNWAEFVHQRGSWDYPFLYFYLVKLATTFSQSPFWVRLPSLVAGILCILLIFTVARKLYSDRVALIAAVLLSVSPLLVYYSQEARPYTFVVLFDLTGRLWVILAVIDRKRYAWYLLGLTYLLGVLTSYFVGLSAINVVVWILLLEVYAGLITRRISLKDVVVDGLHAAIAGMLTLLAFYLLWYPEFTEFSQARLADNEVRLNLATLLYQYRRIVDIEPNWLFVIVGVVLTVLGIVVARTYAGITFLLTGLFGSMIVYFYAAIPATRERYYLHVVPYVLVAVSVAIAWMIEQVTKRQWIRTPRMTAGLYIATILCLALLWLPQLPPVLLLEKTNYHDAASYIEERIVPTDAIVIRKMDGGQFDQFFSDLNRERILRLTPEQIVFRCQNGERVWFTGSNIRRDAGDEQLAWAEDNLLLQVSFPAMSASGKVDVFLCDTANREQGVGNATESTDSVQTAIIVGNSHLARQELVQAETRFQQGINACVQKQCSDEQLFALRLGLARAAYEREALDQASTELAQLANLTVDSAKVAAYATDIDRIFTAYAVDHLDRWGDTPFLLEGGDFEDDRNFSNWTVPHTRYGSAQSLSPLCAFQGNQGLLMQSAQEGYHNGVSLKLPFQFVPGQYYAVGAHIRSEDKSKGLFDQLRVNYLYMQGKGETGNVRGFFKGAETVVTGSENWTRHIEVFKAPDGLADNRLSLYPVLYSGNGTICIDNVFAFALPVADTQILDWYLMNDDLSSASRLLDEIQQMCLRDDCPAHTRFILRLDEVRMEIETGELDKARARFDATLAELALQPDLIQELSTQLEDVVRLLINSGALSDEHMENGGFESTHDNWSFPPQEKYNVTVDVTEECARSGRRGLYVSGQDEGYHNGPSIVLNNVQAGRHYVFAAFVRIESGRPELEGMYLGGRDSKGDYRGLHQDLHPAVDSSNWQLMVRHIQLPDWTSDYLWLSPVLLTGEAAICIDDIFAIPVGP